MKPAQTVVRRLSDGSCWAPAGDTPHPFHGFNFVPAMLKGRHWLKDMKGSRWITYDVLAFEIVTLSK